MSEIKLPVRYSGHGRIIDGSEQTIAFAELPDSGATLADDVAVRLARAEAIVAALNQPNLAPALAAKDEVILKFTETLGVAVGAVANLGDELAAKDAALRECIEAMTKARVCFHQETADDILDEAIAKHRPEEGADNGSR